jgi:hypothetical protein
MRVLTHNTAAVGSGLLAIGPSRAGEYAKVLAAFGEQLPAGWNPEGAHGEAAGWDLVLVEPRTLSILRYDLLDYYLTQVARSSDGAVSLLAEQLHERQARIARAHYRTVEVLVWRLAQALHQPPPRLVDHPLDSARQPLLHTHVILGALTEGGRRLPLDRGRLYRLAHCTVVDYHRRLQEQVTAPLRDPYAWGPPGPDGRAELVGLPAELLAEHSGPCRPLWEITACAGAVGDLVRLGGVAGG